jgi:hypothetical protein
MASSIFASTSISDVLIALAAWTIAITKFHNVWSGGLWTKSRIALYSWLFAVFFAIAMTFQIDVLYRPFDSITLTNLSWLFSYAAGATAIFFGVAIAVDLYAKPSSKARELFWMRSALFTTLAILTVAYLFIVRNPERLDHDIPNNLAELVYMGTLFTYGIGFAVVLARAMLHNYLFESVTPTRIRTLIILIASFASFAYLFLKDIIAIFGYFWPSFDWPPVVLASKLMMGLTALTWAITFLPQKVFLSLAKLVKFLDDWVAFRDLKSIMKQIHRYSRTQNKNDFPYRQFVKNPDYFLYCSLIDILDSKVVLKDLLNSQSKPVVEEMRREAIACHLLLQEICDDGDFWEVVKAYRAMRYRLTHIKPEAAA